MIHELVVLFVVVANAVVLALGSLITHLAYRAYRRTRRREMKRFAVGFGFVTLGTLFGGGLHQLVGTHVLVGVLAQAAFSAVGFGVLTHSLYAEVSDTPRTDVSTGDGRPGR